MEYETINYLVEEGIGIIILQRPKQLNAINQKMGEELLHALKLIKEDPKIGSAIITGGEKVFSAGADIGEVKTISSASEALNFSRRYQQLFQRIENFEKPLIAAVSGFAVGGGCELAMAADLRIASDTARFGLAEINIGALPAGGGTQKLPRLIGIAKAKEMLFFGEAIDAQEAYRLGLVNKVTSMEKLQEEAKNMAQQLNKKSLVALKAIKYLVNVGMNMDFDSALYYEAQSFASLSTSEDFREGISAFFEKRKPIFKGS